MIYIILSPGRTGSSFLSSIIHSYLLYTTDKCEYIDWFDESPNISIDNDIDYVIHTHSKNIISKLNLNPSTITLIINKRNNLFETIMSLEVSTITGETWNYTNKKIEPVRVSIDSFIGNLIRYYKWYDDIDVSLDFYNIKIIYYEDFVSDYLYIGKSFNFLDIPLYSTYTNKSPYDYKDIILNWKDLYSIYNNAIAYNKHGFESFDQYMNYYILDQYNDRDDKFSL